MAKKTWNNPIDKNVDWSGDPVATEGLPVSGEMVQKFIKDSLNGKAGLFYYDTANNRYIVFADEIAKNEYLEDPRKTDLIIGTFDAPFNYTAEINLATPTYNAVYLGDTGNYLDFTFDVKNKQGASTGESVVITYTFIRNATKQVHSQVARHGENIHFNIDKYLGEGSNTIIIGVSGQTTLAATTVAVTYNVVNLQLTDETDISIVYDLSSGPKSMEVHFKVKGSGTKVVEWYLDDVPLEFIKNVDEVVEVEDERVRYIQLSNLQQGRHSLQIRAYTTINGEKFYTQTLYRDIMVYTGVDSNVIVAMAMEIPAEYGLASGSPTIYGMMQYIPYPLRFATYSPNNITVQVEVKMDNEVLGNVSSQNGSVNEFSIVSKTSGNKMISLVGEGGSYDIPAVIAKTNMAIEEITSGLKIDFSAIGRINKSENKDVWEQGDYVGTFEGFEWNVGSGWVNNRLKINAGASFGINYAPLADNPKALGRTLEFEFKTMNVNDDNAVICDLRNSAGAGILITATKVSVTSENGVVVENEFKSNENVRISIVINRATGSTRKGLTLIYTNGSISRGVNWAVDDNYTSDTQILFRGTSGAEVELKSIRIYESALSDDNILNNYILYRDTVAEMLEVYDRNNVYAEGTTTFSPDKMVSRLPVMIVTGDIPTLENTSDKDTQIIVDIEYTNMQDTSRSFKMVGAAMRPQGTSSMGYPKKNFRIYTQEVADTILYDANGNVVEDKLYSFRERAIPVNCWCLKADYAESSGTHNTGIARMWNKALYNMQINNDYVCRTEAQKAALASGYKYDVRTTIDGFPILLFYKKNPSDEPIFIGKYNFNNDKSTEKVFGFTDIPGFDNSRMQCWEVLNNGNSIGLFTDISNFYNDVTSEGKTKKGWEFAFESRYPDIKSPNTDDLYNFAVWMNGVNGDHERFATEKWDHFKIYPMAAYYCYIMRHAAADQLVKNAMFTSEDGQKFYYILYDNDTINGLINTGDIDILPTDDRDSKNESGEYKFAGHSSVLWNMLEADSEFMQIVKDVDNALYSAGISYNDCIRTFDEEQADKWVERVYNQDSEYKYVGPYTNKGINNLFMMQGKRDLHRKWWLSKRFSIYDAKFVSGEYKSQAIELKCINDTPAGQQFSIKAGYPLYYGYGINDLPRETGVALNVGETYTFSTTEVVNRGDPIRIYGAPNIEEIDLSPMANRLAVVTIANVYTEALGTRLKKFILGGEGVNNLEVSEISGLKQAKMLTHLDVRGMHGIKSLDLTSQPYFEELKAIGSEVASVTFAKGAPVNRLELPATMKVLNLEQLPYLTSVKLLLADITGIHTINVKGCPNLSKDFTWIKSWYDRKTTVDSKCTLMMDNVDWTNVSGEEMFNIASIGTIALKGKVTLTDITPEQGELFMRVFGSSVFDTSSEFYIEAPLTLTIKGPTSIYEGSKTPYEAVVYPTATGTMRYRLTQQRLGCSINEATGELTSIENGLSTSSIVIEATFTSANGKETVSKELTVSVIKREYPTSVSISGSGDLKTNTRFLIDYGMNSDAITGLYDVEWSIEGDIAEVCSIEGYKEYCIINLTTPPTDMYGILKVEIKKQVDQNVVASARKQVNYKFVYPSSMTIDGVTSFVGGNKEIFEANVLPDNVDIGVTYAWSISGTTYASIESTFENKCVVNTNKPEEKENFTLTCIASTSDGKVSLQDTHEVVLNKRYSIIDVIYNVTSPNSNIQLIGSSYSLANITSMEVDAKAVSPSHTYTFESSGNHRVRIITKVLDRLFESCTDLIRADFSEYDGDSVSSFTSVFLGCTSLASIEWGESKFPSVQYLASAFLNCSSITTIDLSPFKGAPIKNLFRTFSGCASLTTLNLSPLEEAPIENMEEAFSSCSSLITIKWGDCNFPSIVRIGYIYYGCSALTTLDFSPFKEKTLSTGNVDFIASGCVSAKVIIAAWQNAPTTSNRGMFGSSESNYAGRNTYNTGENILYVPEGATGYDSGQWLDPLQNSSKCGFEISYTL